MIAYECPRCGIGIEGQTGFNTMKGMPDPGDVMVCVYCSSIGVLNADGTVREADQEERLMMMQQNEVQQALSFAYRFQKSMKQ